MRRAHFFAVYTLEALLWRGKKVVFPPLFLLSAYVFFAVSFLHFEQLQCLFFFFFLPLNPRVSLERNCALECEAERVKEKTFILPSIDPSLRCKNTLVCCLYLRKRMFAERTFLLSWYLQRLFFFFSKREDNDVKKILFIIQVDSRS